MSNTATPSRLSDMLIAHTVRLIEESGPLEDSAAMDHAYRAAQGREQRLIERARALGRRLKLDDELARWRALSPFVGLALALAVFLVAHGIAAAMIGGDRSLNAVLAFLVALGMHAATLALWAVALLLLPAFGGGALARLSLGNLLLRLVAWLPLERGPHSLTMLRAATGLLQRERLLPWAFGMASHALWALAFVLVLAALWLAFSFQAYRLTWETTILSADFFVGFVEATGRLPALIGFPVPDAATLRAPDAAGSDQRAWAWWLIGCVLVYGLLPRIALAGVSWLMWRRGRQRLTLDTADPYFRKLLARFDDLEASTVIDRERRAAIAAEAPRAHPLPTQRQAAALVGFELPPELHWPPDGLTAGLTERIAGTGDERRGVLGLLAQAQPRRLLLACHAPSSPDRGTERFLREAAGHAGASALLLLPPGDDRHAQRWRAWLQATGMQAVASFTDARAAAAWQEAPDG